MSFNHSSTTDDVLANIDLTGRRAVVTGGSAGMGAEIARALASKGADVTILGRGQEKLDAVAASIKAQTGKDVETGVLELDKPETIRSFAADWLARHGQLDLLINNAGILGIPLQRTAEGWEMQFATNHLGHFLLTNLLRPALLKAGTSRVVNVSSSGHKLAPVDLDDPNFERHEYTSNLGYGQSKTANIWFANELDRRFADQGLRAFSVHPGGVQTELGRHLNEERLNDLLAVVRDWGSDPTEGKTVPQGAATAVWGATSPELDGKGGLYLVDCQIAGNTGTNFKTPAEWAYSPENEGRLWELSNDLLNTTF